MIEFDFLRDHWTILPGYDALPVLIFFMSLLILAVVSYYISTSVTAMLYKENDCVGTPGEIRERVVYERCLEHAPYQTNIIPVVGTNGQTSAGVSVTGGGCIKKEQVWITEKWEFGNWYIQEVRLKK